MKKLLALIIAIIALIGMNTNNSTKPAETPVMKPTTNVVETVKEETETEPAMTVTEESKSESTETKTVITEPKQEPKAQTEKPKEQKKETPPAETENHESGGIVIGDPTPTQTYSCGISGTTARDRKRTHTSASWSRKGANTAAPTVVRASIRWMNGDKDATHRVNARNTIFTPIRSGTARLVISSAETAETAETAPAFSS